ncbi:MAG: hypothetical protein AAGH90_10235 [Pseudomonadota bacterium]
MTTPQNLSWTANSTASNLTYIEVIFQLSPSFFPDPDNLTAANSIALPMLPSADRKSGEYTSVEALDNVEDLITHYKTLLDLTDRHRLTYSNYFYHFWLRLRLRSEDAEVDFAGYDTWRQMRTLFAWLEQAEDRLAMQEISDGWELPIARMGDRLHFKESGVDQSLRTTNIAFSRDELLSRLTPLRTRVDQVISRLVDEIGEDYWTDFRRDLA